MPSHSGTGGKARPWGAGPCGKDSSLDLRWTKHYRHGRDPGWKAGGAPISPTLFLSLVSTHSLWKLFKNQIPSEFIY